jgi:NAD(P)-dependent dehydrogenase (short-subunit alcohol dehydrogenase family)
LQSASTGADADKYLLYVTCTDSLIRGLRLDRLKGKSAIVTGAAQGLGQAYAQALASEGACVCVADVKYESALQVADAINKSGGTALAINTDVSDQVSTERMARETFARFGRIDILVSNAAIYYGIKRTPFDEIVVDEWDRMMAVNVKGCWLCARAVFPYMKQQKSGKIVNVSSGVAFSPNAFLAHYVTSKAAVVGLTRALSRELGQYGIKVNAIAPGFTMTEASKQLGGDVAAYVQSLSIKREQMPDDMVGTVLYLCSRDSDFVTGQTIVVDGGRVFH